MRQMILISLVIHLFGQHANTCPSSVMPGIGLGLPVDSVQNEVASWEECRDLCCNSSACVTWTLLLDEQMCFLRNQLGEHVLKSKNQISGLTKGFVLPSPHRNQELQFYVGIVSTPKKYWASVSVLSCLCVIIWQHV